MPAVFFLCVFFCVLDIIVGGVWPIRVFLGFLNIFLT